VREAQIFETDKYTTHYFTFRLTWLVFLPLVHAWFHLKNTVLAFTLAQLPENENPYNFF
jgi:hypothetical protein